MGGQIVNFCRKGVVVIAFKRAVQLDSNLTRYAYFTADPLPQQGVTEVVGV